MANKWSWSKTFLIAVTVLVFETSTVWADLVTKCEAPEGYSYFFHSLLVPSDKAGWKKDAVSKGSYIVTRDAGGEYDIIFTDALNRTISSREDGGQIVTVSQSDDHLIIIVSYPEKNVETWFFNIDRRGVGKLTISQARYGSESFIKKHSLMTAGCTK